MTKQIIIGIIIAIAAGAGIFLYKTRPVPAPVENMNTITDELASETTNAKGTTYQIVADESTASFSIDETLRGKPFTAIGTTNQISGTVLVSPDTLEIGMIKINAGTFKTESVQRDGAIVRFILKSDKPENQFITFVPTTTIKNQNGSATVTGNLTVSGITKPVTLDITTKIDGDTITAKVTGTLKRSDFDLNIPNIPFVANVSDTFEVDADIVAKKAE